MVSIEQTIQDYQISNKPIDQFLEACELKLDEAGKISATQAFNLGCTIALIPAGIIILIAYIATRTWMAALLTGMLMSIAIIGFANLVAIIARTKAMERVYTNELKPEIINFIEEIGLTRSDFEQYAWQNLPNTSHLLQFLPKPTGSEIVRKRRTLSSYLRRQK